MAYSLTLATRKAHEDDAERAIHAGLGVVESVANLNDTVGNEQGIELGVRVGIATGPVVVGDLIGEGASQESSVVGETPNLAARLQALAAPNTVVVSPGTHELAAGRFEYGDLGDHDLKGISESVQAWRVIAPTAAKSRFEAAHRTGLTLLVGREHEIGLLLERWAQAKEGDGQAILLSGEAGIGKSRITETLRERTATDGPVRLRYQCSPYHTNSALHPIIEQLERAAQFDSEDTNEVKLDKLESLLALGTSDVEVVAALLAPLLSIPSEGRYAPLDTTPDRQKELTLEALTAQLRGLSRNQPVLFIFEDVHWADPTSLELLELTIERAQTIPVLVVLTYRPEFSPPWSGHTHVTSLTLNRFTRNLASVMIENVTGGKSLPDEVMEQIIEKTDGVPLFVEELTKTILESGQLSEESDRYVASGPLLEVAIPSKLHDSLMARLDRLGVVKEVAQMAAAIGREFDYDLLAGVSPLSFAQLRSALDELIDAELVFRRGRSQEGGYIFKHALVQDAAYGSLLKRKRQGLHRRIAEVLQSRFPESAESEPELLAHHFTEAALFKPAVGKWKKAGLRAIDSSANAEAASHLAKALELFGKLEDANDSPQEELSLQIPLATALTAARGYAAPETGDALLRARELCRRIGDTAQMFTVLYRVWSYRYVGGDFQDALELAKECLDLAQSQGERTRLMAAHSALGQNLTSIGRFDAGQQHLEKSVALYHSEEDLTLWQDYGEDPAIVALFWRHWIAWFKGFPEQALSQSQEAIEMTQKRSDMVSVGWGLASAGVLRYLRGEQEATQQAAQDTIDFATEQKLPIFVAFGSILKGWALASLGDEEEGVAQMHRALEQWKATGTKMFVPLFLILLAEGYASSRDFGEALKLLDEASNLVRTSGEVMWESELLRLRGSFLLSASENLAAAESAFNQAIEIAGDQQSHSLELRAATSLARLWQGQGKLDEARELLGPIYEWFTEGFDTADLKEAEALLKQLS